MDAKAIETIYRGYRFRSRLEARYAVFFDALDLPFEYEKEGFTLEDGTKYLPDFWLPTLKLWVEIKGELDFIEKTVSECSTFASSKVEKLYSFPALDLMRRFRGCQPWPIALIVGQPGEHSIWFFGWDLSSNSAGAYEDNNALWCVANDQVTLNIHITNPDREIYADSLYGSMLQHFTYARDHRCILEPIENALLQARQARFEHREMPSISIGNALG
jgi:hypothetical protein